MKDVTIEDSTFTDYIWQNDRLEATNLSNLERVEATDWKPESPEELKDPNWLADELDGTHELIRAIAAGSIADIPREAAHQAVDMAAFSEASTNEWDAANEYIRAVEAGKIEDVPTKDPSQKSAQKSVNKKANKESAIQEKRMHEWERLGKKLSKDIEWVELGRRARELEELDKGASLASTGPW